MAWGSNFSVGVHSAFAAAAAPPSTSWVAAASAAAPAAAPGAVLVSPILSGVRFAAATRNVIAAAPCPVDTVRPSPLVAGLLLH
jgi:hypothetical protein